MRSAKAAAMDVERISAMGGVMQEHNPLWMRGKMRRRKFTQDVEPEVESDDEDATAMDMEDGHDGLLDVVA